MFRIVAVVREKKKIEKRSIRPRPCSVNYFSVHCVCVCVCFGEQNCLLLCVIILSHISCLHCTLNV